MAYKLFEAMDIYHVIARWHAGYKIRQISRTLGIDRKTVRRYIRLAEQAGFSLTQPLPERTELLSRLAVLIPTNERPHPVKSAFAPHQEEILALLAQTTDPLKPKTVYEVLCARYQLTASYSTFKRALRDLQPHLTKPRTTCRFETAAGDEVQVDYAKMGLLDDPLSQRQRVVHAFIATLSFSRLKYVEFVYRLDQQSFVASHVRMFEFFGGVPKRVLIDNLKTGVRQPDLYDPKLNRVYQELADHYGFFIDPARVRHPQDKGKVERSVPVVRELFRKLKAVHPHLDFATANQEARDWARHSNGMKVHGTTGLKPLEVFHELEQRALLSLPTLAFEMATWKEAKVHVDQFIQFEKKFYSVPSDYVGKTVWVRGTEKMVAIFYQHQLVRQYPKSRQTRLFEPLDFPPNVQVMLGEYAIQNLLARAAQVGPNFKQLITAVLAPHAKLNYRRALGLLSCYPKYPAALLEAAAPLALANKIVAPQLFKRLLEKRSAPDEAMPISHQTQELLRPIEYFIHSTPEVPCKETCRCTRNSTA